METLQANSLLQLVVGFFLILFSASIAVTTLATLVVLGNNRGTDAFNFLVFLLDFFGVGFRIGVKPGLTILESIHNLLLLLFIELLTQALVFTGSLCRRPHRVEITVERVLGINTFLDLLVLVCNLLLSEAPLVVGNSNFLSFPSALVLSTDV